MVYGPVSSVTNDTSNNSQISSIPSMNNNQISAMLTSGNIDPKFAVMLINQMTANNVNSILFGDNEQGESSDYLGSDIFGSTTNDNDFTNLGITSLSSNILSQSNSLQGGPTQFEMSIYSTLIGKTVTAKNPSTNSEISGKVTGVQNQSGKVILDIGGTMVPVENLTKIKG